MMLGTSQTTKHTYEDVDSSDNGRKDIGINTGELTKDLKKVTQLVCIHL